MKLKYYGYFFHEVNTERKILCGIKPFLQAFCAYENATFKNSFLHVEEKLSLIDLGHDAFLFLKSKDTEIAKAMNWSNISVEELSARLEEDEGLAFASHVIIKDSYLAFASTMLAPTISAFSSFIGDILSRLGYVSHQFRLCAFTEKLSREEALQMQFIGTTSIQVTAGSSLFQDLGATLGLTAPRVLDDLGAFELILKPKRRRGDIKDISRRIIEMDPQGVDKLTIRARRELDDRLTDFRLEGLGIVHDTVEPAPNQSVKDAILDLIRDNDDLAQRVRDYEQDDEYSREDLDALSELDSADAWDNKLGRLQVVGSARDTTPAGVV